MTYIIGMQPHSNRLWTTQEFLRGGIAAAGTRGSAVGSDGATREYMAVQLPSGTWINGHVLVIGGNGVAALGTAGPALTSGGRVGILALATASTTATLTAAATAFAWAQIYGRVTALTLTVSVSGALLTMGADGQLIHAVANSASAQLDGITSLATSAAAGLLDVLLQYPKFQGGPA